jgi:hypothetical protein
MMRVAVALLGVALLGASCSGGGASGAPSRNDATAIDRGNSAGADGDGQRHDAAANDRQAVDQGASLDAGAIGDAGAGVDLAPPSCLTEGALTFSPPVSLFLPSGRRSRAMAATPDRKVTVVGGWWGRAGVFYFDSLDGGRTFRPALQLSSFGPDNVHIALGAGHVYLTSALFDLTTSVFLWHGAVDNLDDPSKFQAIDFGPDNTYAGTPVTASDKRVALFLENGSLDTLPDEGQYVSSAASDDGSFSDPHKLFWPAVCTGGLYHSNGKLFMAYPLGGGLDGSPPPLEMRWSDDNGATFSEPVARVSSGGQIWCPTLFEVADGSVLVVVREGNAIGSTQRTVAVKFDVTSNQFGPDVFVYEGQVLCSNAAMTQGGRLFVTGAFGDLSSPPTGVGLRFSDDGGVSWSDQQRIPWIGAGQYCPDLAASDDELYMMWNDQDALFFGRAGGPTVCD